MAYGLSGPCGPPLEAQAFCAPTIGSRASDLCEPQRKSELQNSASLVVGGLSFFSDAWREVVGL